MRSPTLPAVLLSALFAAGCTQDSPVGVANDHLTLELSRGSSASSNMVPFKATYTAQAGFTRVAPEVCPTGLANITQGTGQATHLGRITGETFSCINLTTLQATQGRFTFTAPDGSRISGTYELQGTPLSETVLRFEGPFTIAGGTGRFEGARGGGQVTGSVNLAIGQAVLDFDGTMSSVGSLRRGG